MKLLSLFSAYKSNSMCITVNRQECRFSSVKIPKATTTKNTTHAVLKMQN